MSFNVGEIQNTPQEYSATAAALLACLLAELTRTDSHASTTVATACRSLMKSLLSKVEASVTVEDLCNSYEQWRDAKFQPDSHAKEFLETSLVSVGNIYEDMLDFGDLI